jgi:hypothetical protein
LAEQLRRCEQRDQRSDAIEDLHAAIATVCDSEQCLFDREHRLVRQRHDDDVARIVELSRPFAVSAEGKQRTSVLVHDVDNVVPTIAEEHAPETVRTEQHRNAIGPKSLWQRDRRRRTGSSSLAQGRTYRLEHARHGSLAQVHDLLSDASGTVAPKRAGVGDARVLPP